jgi:hypothetical protein
MRHQVCKAVVRRGGAAGESAHRPDEIEFSVELEDDAAQRRFGSLRPGAGRGGEVANLYGHVLDNIQTDPMPPTASDTGSEF